MKRTKQLTAAIIASAVALSMLSIPAYAMDDSTPPLTETAAASSDDMKAPLADLVTEYVWRDYYEKTGNMAVECEMLENDEGTEATVTLKDETGAVLDVYTVDLLTGIGRTGRNLI